MKNLKISKFSIEGYKGIQEKVELNPKGNSLVLVGGNGAGKTSLIDALINTLSGEYPTDVINRLSSEAKVKITLEDEDGNPFAITQKISQSGKRFSYSKDGYPVTAKPKKAFEKLITGFVDFRPSDFVENGKTAKGRKEQVETFLKVLGIDKEAFETKESELTQARVESHRKGEGLRNEQTAIGFDDTLDFSEVPDEKELKKQITKAKKSNLAIEKFQKEVSESTRELEDLTDDLLAKNAQIKALEDKVKELKLSCNTIEGSIEKAKNVLFDAQEKGKKLGKKVNLESLYKKTALVTQAKGHAEKEKRFEAKEIEINSEIANYKELTSKIETLRRGLKSEISKKVKSLDLTFPIEVQAEKILVGENRLSLESLNTAEQIFVGLELYFLTKPTLKVVRIDGTNFLAGEAQLKRLQALIEKYNFQAFWEVPQDVKGLNIEIVEEGDDITKIINKD